MVNDDSATSLSCAELSLRQLSDRLRETQSGGVVRLLDLPAGIHGLGAGSETDATFYASNSAGDYALIMAANGSWEIDGDVGQACGHSLISGKILVRGSAGDCFGAFASGGFIAAHGRAADAAGYALAGADVLVRGRAGKFCGCYMTDGVVVLANGCGEELGMGMTGGNIYLRGDAASVSPNVRKQRMKDADAMRLSLLLARADILGDAREFNLYQVRREN